MTYAFPCARRASGVVLIFPGQGAQHARMAVGLYGVDSTFTWWMDRAFTLLEDAGPALRAEWLADLPSPSYDDVTVAQPLLYIVDHALGRMVLEWDIEVRALLGHGVGETAAATLAGVLTLEEGIAVMRHRMDAFSAAPEGGIMAVGAAVEDLPTVLGAGVHLAAVNGPRQVLLAGSLPRLEEAAQELGEQGFVCRPVLARQPLHSPLVKEAVLRSIPVFETIGLRPPTIPIFSAYTTGVLPDREATAPDFWAWQAATPVHFAGALTSMVDEMRPAVVLEAGPGQGLTMLARRHATLRELGGTAVPLLPPRPQGDHADREAVLQARARAEGSGRPVRVAPVAVGGGRHG